MIALGNHSEIFHLLISFLMILRNVLLFQVHLHISKVIYKDFVKILLLLSNDFIK